ncbi:protein FAM76B-like isoform X1 [Littorina saxatilis]|uniref:protein FAM76B-like isoform X1 n=1 Tax=Littorina saxatilis TaxID=31220 RepID=UPI0038B48CF3
MAALFACTKCHRRFPFDDLSHGDQLCKECRSNFPVVKCTYCRAEFQLNSKGSTTTICSKCAQNVKIYGKPTACEYCSILAGFIGKRCQRCVNSEKKWGPPMTCEQCKLKCAFDRSDDCKQKTLTNDWMYGAQVDGKQLCWLCTQAYKRVLAKTRKSQDFTMSMVRKSSTSASMQDGGDSLENRIHRLTSHGKGGDNQGGLAAVIMKLASSNTKPSASGSSSAAEGESTGASTSADKAAASNGHHHRKHSKSKSLTEKTSNLLDRTSDLLSEKGEGREGKDGKPHKAHRSRSHHHHHSKNHHSKHHHQKNKEESQGEESSPAKKPKLDKSVSNGVSVSTPKSTGSNVSDVGVQDTNSSDNVILITQLREQIESLKKQLQGKDAQLLEKDKKYNELKAETWESEKDARTKVTNVQKLHDEAITSLQVKNRELQRQVTKLSKGVKKSVLDSITSSS